MPVMDDTPCCRFFLDPSCAPQRQYEALRAVFIDRCRQQDVAQRFGYCLLYTSPSPRD